MEETTIKYENCEDLYVGQEGAVPEDAHMPIPMKNPTPSYEATPHSMKRSYNEFAMASGGGAVGLGLGIGPHNFGAASNYHMGAVAGMPPGAQMPSHEQYRNFYAPTQHAAHLQQQLQQPLLTQDAAGTPKKRYRRGDKNILFSPPFFELQQDFNAIDPRSSLAARCLSCHVVLRGHKNVSSNFLKHMKRVHPEVYKIYENIKLLKFGVVKGSSSSASSTAAAVAMGHDDVLNSSSETVTPDQPHHQYFDASAFLEHMSSTAGDDAPSETTENSGTPPTSTEAIETPENSRESQQQILQRQPVALEDEPLSVPIPTEREENSLKADLSPKNLDSKISQILDAKLKAFVSKTEFNETTQIVSNLVERRVAQRIATQSTVPEEKSEISTATATSTTTTTTTAALQTQLNALQQECQELRTHAQQAQQSKRQLHRELETMDRELRRNKLIVRNLAVADSEKPREAVEQLFRERLELPDIELQSATIISRNKEPHQRQTLLVELKNNGGQNDAKAIFRQCFKLKNSGVFIETEMSPFARKRKDKLLVLRKELLRRNAELKVRVQGTQLSVDGKQFYWDEVEGLCIGGSKARDMAAINAADYLKTVTGGLDLKEFLNVLQNYDVQMR